MSTGNEQPPQKPFPVQERSELQGPVRVHVAALLRGGREAILEHGGQDYRLRITANGKLILTK